MAKHPSLTDLKDFKIIRIQLDKLLPNMLMKRIQLPHLVFLFLVKISFCVVTVHGPQFQIYQHDYL